MNKKKIVKFKGYDWTELAEAFGIKVKQDDDVVFEKTIKYLQDHIQDKETAKLVRKYLKLLAKHGNTYNTPVWEGMLKIEHDETLLVFTIELLHKMWD